MNSLVDDLISDDVNRALEENKYPWIKPIVQLIENSRSPFLSPDFFNMCSYKNFLNDPTARFFLSSGYEMKITFDEADYSKLLSSQFTDIAFSPLTVDRMRTLHTTYRIFITFKVNSIESAIPFIEPMRCTAFVYDKMAKTIISDSWNFIPEKCQPFFNDIQFSFDNTNTASFMINPSTIMKKNGIIILLFSHPTTVDNGINTVVKYYQNPASISSASAAKAATTSFSKNPKAFSTFCWTYALLSSESIDKLEFPSPFLIDHSVSEGEIADLISEAQSKHLKQVPFSISFSVEPYIFQRILRPISTAKILPYLTPIHQLSVHLHQLKMAALSGARNIMIRISLESSETNSPLSVIHSKYNSVDLVGYEYSRVCYHAKSPKFDDYFLIDLPYPLDTTFSLVFQIYHVHVKTNDTKSLTEIGKAVLPLFQSSDTNKDNVKEKRKSKDKQKIEDNDNMEKNEKNDNVEKTDIDDKEKDKRPSRKQSKAEKNKKDTSKAAVSDPTSENELVFIPNDIHTISASDKTSKLIISTYLRSNLISNDRQYIKFSKYASEYNSAALDPELIKSISPVTLTINLMLILDKIIKIYEKMPVFSFDPILALYSSVSLYLKSHRLNHYLLLYVYYFAFRDTSKIILPELNDTNQSNQQQQTSLCDKTTTSLIDLDQVEFELKDQHRQANSDTLIDFGNDSLFKNVDSDESNSRRPSLIMQSLYKESDDILIHTKMLRGIIIFLKEKETEAVDILYPLYSFINGLLIKSLVVSKDRSLTDDFIEYTDLFTKYASKSENINDISIKYGKFVDLLFDIGLQTAAAVANSAFIRNCPLNSILTYVSKAYRPEYFLYSVRFIENFVDQFCHLVNLSFSGDNCSVMQPFFGTINHLCSIYDESLKVELASKLFKCIIDITPSQIPPGDQISEGVKFINFVLTYCNEIAMQSVIVKQKLPSLMSLIHYLLNRATSIPVSSKRPRMKLAYLANSKGVISISSAAGNFANTMINDTQTTNMNLIKTCSSLDSSKVASLTLEGNNSSNNTKNKNYSDTVKVKKVRYNLTMAASFNQKGIKSKDDFLVNIPHHSNSHGSHHAETSIIADKKVSFSNCFDVELCTMTQAALFRFICCFLNISDLNGGAYLFQFAYHALQLLNLPKPLVLKSYFLLHQIIQKFSPGIIEIFSPCMTKVIHTLFKKALITQHYHKYIASIIATLFNRDLAAYNNNNRSLTICTQALSMIHYSQLTLDRFNQFMKLLSDSTINNTTNNNNNNSKKLSKSMKKNKNSGSASNVALDGLKEFYETFKKLRLISIDLENPKLTPSQKATHFIRRFYAFKHSPDAQFNALEDLKRHQSESKNDLEAMNTTILQAALIYEYLVKLNRMPNYFNSKFGGKHKYHLISSTSSFEGFMTSKSKSPKKVSSIYLIGSTSLCPAEIMADFPKIPSFCDSDVFSESGFVSLLFKIFNEAEKIHRSVISNIILDLIWPIYDARCLYGQMSCVFETYEKIFSQRLAKARSQSRPIIGQIKAQMQSNSTTQTQPNSTAQTQVSSTTQVQSSSITQTQPDSTNQVQAGSNEREREPFDGTVATDKKISSRNSRTSKNRKSTRSKKYSEMNENDFGGFDSNSEVLGNITAGNFEDSDNHNSYFRVLFCGKIFESDNGRAFIYRAEPNTSISQFKAQLNKYYEFLMGRNKIVIIDDKDENQTETTTTTNETTNENINENSEQNNNENETNKNKDESSENKETKDTKDTKDNKETKETKDTKETKETKDNKETKDTKDTKENIENIEIKENKEKEDDYEESENTTTTDTNYDDTKIDSIFKMDDNIGYIKVDKATEVNYNEQTPSYQHQIFYVDEYSYTGKYNFYDDLFFNSSHNNTNSSNFSNVCTFFNTYNNYNNCTNDSSYLNYDSIEQTQSKSSINYNYSYFNIYNYINNYMKSTSKRENDLHGFDAQKNSLKKLYKRTMRRNFLAVKTQIPSLLERSEIIKVEASDFSPIMCAYQHIVDFVVKMKKLVEVNLVREVQNLLVSELTENKIDNFIMIINVFVEKMFLNENEEEEEEEEESEELIDDNFKENDLNITKNRKEFDKIVPIKLKGILGLFMNILERAIKLHGKWVINNLEYVPLQYQFEHQFRIYSAKFNSISKL